MIFFFFFFYQRRKEKKSGKKTKHSIYCIQKKKKIIDITKHEKITWGEEKKKLTKVEIDEATILQHR